MVGESPAEMSRPLFFMLKRGEHYRDSATNYARLSVRRKASRWIEGLIRFGFMHAAARFPTTHLHDPRAAIAL